MAKQQQHVYRRQSLQAVSASFFMSNAFRSLYRKKVETPAVKSQKQIPAEDWPVRWQKWYSKKSTQNATQKDKMGCLDSLGSLVCTEPRVSAQRMHGHCRVKEKSGRSSKMSNGPVLKCWKSPMLWYGPGLPAFASLRSL
mmetsp:Transcript_68889/g.114078  ORF Transcript_68889/g.114078 Transcript_68889/m.114078 type:complete len:140 (+) Transcript_68889:158-577(+)